MSYLQRAMKYIEKIDNLELTELFRASDDNLWTSRGFDV